MKNARDYILSRLPSTTPQPLRYDIEPTTYKDVVATFESNLIAAGGSVVYSDDILSHYQDITRIIDTIKDDKIDISLEEMEQNELLIIQAKFAVAENGAVWIEPNFPRELITLSRHIAIKLSAKEILSNMHQAYSMIDSSSLDFGMFLSGPSKTADIEQALVIGAHGALGLKCFIS